jgi:hypothetical protein
MSDVVIPEIAAPRGTRASAIPAAAAEPTIYGSTVSDAIRFLRLIPREVFLAVRIGTEASEIKWLQISRNTALKALTRYGQHRRGDKLPSTFERDELWIGEWRAVKHAALVDSIS